MPLLVSSNSAANEDNYGVINIAKWGCNFSDSVKNIVGKEEIACYKQFLLFPQCFQKLSVVNALK